MNPDDQQDILGEILARLAAIERNIDGIREPILRLATHKETRTQQAKHLGVHRNTLLARERRERIRLMAEGKLKPQQLNHFHSAHQPALSLAGFCGLGMAGT